MTKEPSYQLLARDLRQQILNGEFADGRQLPTEADLAASYAVSRQTVRRAYQNLVADGMVYRIRGRGTFAQNRSDGYVRQVGSVDDLIGLSDDTAMKVVKPLRRKVDLVCASRLRLSSDVVHEMQFVRTHGDIHFCITTVCVPAHVAALLANVDELHKVGAVSRLTVLGLLDARLNSPITQAQQSITVGAISPEDAPHLGVGAGHASLQIDRLYMDAFGNGTELAISHFLPEHYSYRISLLRNV